MRFPRSSRPNLLMHFGHVQKALYPPFAPIDAFDAPAPRLSYPSTYSIKASSSSQTTSSPSSSSLRMYSSGKSCASMRSVTRVARAYDAAAAAFCCCELPPLTCAFCANDAASDADAAAEAAAAARDVVRGMCSVVSVRKLCCLCAVLCCACGGCGGRRAEAPGMRRERERGGERGRERGSASTALLCSASASGLLRQEEKKRRGGFSGFQG